MCDDDYGPTMRTLIGAPFVENYACMRDRFPRSATGGLVTDCHVKATTLRDDGTEAQRELPACDAGRNNTPCWRFDQKLQCEGVSPDGVGFVADYGTMDGRPIAPPPRTTAPVECATIAN